MIVAVAEQSQVGQARRFAGEPARSKGLSAKKIALVATEQQTAENNPRWH